MKKRGGKLQVNHISNLKGNITSVIVQIKK